jgi:hypothetical protein
MSFGERALWEELQEAQGESKGMSSAMAMLSQSYKIVVMPRALGASWSTSVIACLETFQDGYGAGGS